MSNHRDRDTSFNFDQHPTQNSEAIDLEIERLQSSPGYLERLFQRVSGSIGRRPRQSTYEPTCYAEQSLSGNDFTRAYLSRADFRGADLRRSVFTGATLDGALFCDARMIEANFAEAIMSGADLRGADLSGANLIGCDLSGADLRGANLQGAYLWGADFGDADLAEALLDGAYAGGSIFSHAQNLTLEQFRSTIHDETGAYRLSMLPDDGPSKQQHKSVH